MVGDYYNDRWKRPEYEKAFTNIPEISRAEFEALKKEVLEMKGLLRRAKEYDERNNEPNCEKPEKVKLLLDIAKLFGVDLTEELSPPKKITSTKKKSR